MPPLMGWTAARGEIDIAAWVLFAILFLWQFPHFLAIAWMYREDYGRAGICMLPVVEPDGRVTGQQIIVYSLMLIPVSLLPVILESRASSTWLRPWCSVSCFSRALCARRYPNRISMHDSCCWRRAVPAAVVWSDGFESVNGQWSLVSC